MLYHKSHSDILKLYKENVLHPEGTVVRDPNYKGDYPGQDVPTMHELSTEEEKDLAGDLDSLIKVIRDMSDAEYENWLAPTHGPKEQYIEMLKKKITKLTGGI